ncbi:MAG: 30S ribosomal protein S17 [Planctomycetes bacterium]|nr:30S ribosomal protein S17 [Planctomycetota bacterium]
MTERGKRKTVLGTVTSDKMAKTIVVTTERLVRHPRYKKYVKRFSAYKAHDEKREAKVGDRVEIMETHPISKTKHWRLVKVVGK